MFTTTNLNDARVTTGKYKKLIHEDTSKNITVEWEQGYMNGETFISLGSASKCFQDSAESTEYTDMVAALPGWLIVSSSFSAAIEGWLVAHL